MESECIECAFCGKPGEEATLIDMGINSVVVSDDGLIEFSELLRDLFGSKVCLLPKKLISSVMQVMRLIEYFILVADKPDSVFM